MASLPIPSIKEKYRYIPAGFRIRTRPPISFEIEDEAFQSAPELTASHHSGERLPSSDAAVSGADTVMAGVGYFQNIPVFWIMMGLPIAAAAIFTWILRFSEWRDKVSASGKLRWTVFIAGEYKKDDQGAPVAIDKAQIGLHLVISEATFPISIVVEELATSFEGNYPPAKPRDTDRTVVNPGNIQAFNDNMIPMNGAPLKELVEGTIRFKLRYGHPGREKYPIVANLKVQGQLNRPAGGYISIAHSEIP